MPIGKITGATQPLNSLTNVITGVTQPLNSLTDVKKEFDKTVLPGSLPRKKINFDKLEYKTYNFNLNDSTKASLRVGHDSNKMISSLDFAYLNKFKHIQKDGGLDGDTLRSFIRNIYEDSKSVIKNGISFNKIQNSILEFLIKL